MRFITVHTTRLQYRMQAVKGMFGQGKDSKEERTDEPRADSGAGSPIDSVHS